MLTQFPLSHSWACIIHKTQGMPLQESVISLEAILLPGQAYVAFSRVTEIHWVSLVVMYVKTSPPFEGDIDGTR